MRIALVLLSLVLVAGCGDGRDPKSDPSSSGAQPGASSKPSAEPGSEFMPPGAEETAAALPKCSEIWVAGQTLPADYAGCQTDSGGLDQGSKYVCTDGGADLIGHNEQFFARLGGPIQENGEDDAAFSQELFEVCKPE